MTEGPTPAYQGTKGPRDRLVDRRTMVERSETTVRGSLMGTGTLEDGNDSAPIVGARLARWIRWES